MSDTTEARDAQPAEFPLDFEEWAAEQPRIHRTLLAGFRYHVRATGHLRSRWTRARWQKEFTTFANTVPGTRRGR